MAAAYLCPRSCHVALEGPLLDQSALCNQQRVSLAHSEAQVMLSGSGWVCLRGNTYLSMGAMRSRAW